MAIISHIGRRSLKIRLLICTIFLLLTLGALTMLYPFMLMIAGSTKSAVDTPDADVIPPFLRDEVSLYRKYVEGLFNESFEAMQIAYHTEATSFLTLQPPAAPRAALVQEWRRFVTDNDLPFYYYALGSVYCPLSRNTAPHELRTLKRVLIGKFHGDIEQLNNTLDTSFVNWNAFFILPEDFLPRRNQPGDSPLELAVRRFKQDQLLEDHYYFSPEGFYKTSFLKTQYTKQLDAYNKAHASQYVSWDQVHLARRLPTAPGHTQKERDDWEQFVRTLLNLLWIRTDAEAAPAYRDFLHAKYGDIQTLNRNYESRYTSFEEVPLVEEPPKSGLRLSDWDAFLQGWKDPDTGKVHLLPAEMIRIHSVDFQFRDHLRDRYGSVTAANQALGTSSRDWMDILPPQRDLHYLAFQEKKGSLRWEFVRRNYLSVIDYMVLHGRGILNTAIYCALAIVSALIVNPLAAYALSRYKPPSAYKILLFLMLTMAFPPMVTQIPAFLMLREFNMLNTFWALVLPGIAHGYSIFLLKGFFDSLPQELYESAEIDGAGEFRIFWQITMNLSKPILAVIALNAFTQAYSNFMMALLICQDERMWTLMPWLYQLQQSSGQGIIYASLIIAAVPTFLIFALCQNIIMRGIVVPVEK